MVILQCSSFQDLYCCVPDGSFFSVMGMALLYRRLNIQIPPALHAFRRLSSPWHTDGLRKAIIFVFPSFFFQQAIEANAGFSLNASIEEGYTCTYAYL